MADLRTTIELEEQQLLRNLYKYESQAIREGFQVMAERAVAPPNMMFLYYEYETDPREGKFVNPLDVKPNLDAQKEYQLDYELVTMHVNNLIDELNINKDKPLEHRLFTRVPLVPAEKRDWLEWIITSGIDVFLEKDRDGRDKKLQTFSQASTPTSILSDQEKIIVGKGEVSLGQGLWGHHEKNWFTKFWGILTKVFNGPLLAVAGIPALVPTALGFVNKVLQDYEAEAKLGALWQTKKLNFKIAPTVQADFGLKAGTWIIIDTDYVQRNEDLKNHKVDFALQTFELLDAQNKPVAAPYLVQRISLKET